MIFTIRKHPQYQRLSQDAKRERSIITTRLKSMNAIALHLLHYYSFGQCNFFRQKKEEKII